MSSSPAHNWSQPLYERGHDYSISQPPSSVPKSYAIFPRCGAQLWRDMQGPPQESLTNIATPTPKNTRAKPPRRLAPVRPRRDRRPSSKRSSPLPSTSTRPRCLRRGGPWPRSNPAPCRRRGGTLAPIRRGAAVPSPPGHPYPSPPTIYPNPTCLAAPWIRTLWQIEGCIRRDQPTWR